MRDVWPWASIENCLMHIHGVLGIVLSVQFWSKMDAWSTRTINNKRKCRWHLSLSRSYCTVHKTLITITDVKNCHKFHFSFMGISKKHHHSCSSFHTCLLLCLSSILHTKASLVIMNWYFYWCCWRMVIQLSSYISNFMIKLWRQEIIKKSVLGWH